MNTKIPYFVNYKIEKLTDLPCLYYVYRGLAADVSRLFRSLYIKSITGNFTIRFRQNVPVPIPGFGYPWPTRLEIVVAIPKLRVCVTAPADRDRAPFDPGNFIPPVAPR